MYQDDLEARAMQANSDVVTSVEKWLESQTSDALIRIGNKALGNQTALEIAQGQTGDRKPIIPGSGAADASLKNSLPYPNMNLPIIGVVSMPVVILAGLGIYFLMKHRR